MKQRKLNNAMYYKRANKNNDKKLQAAHKHKH